MTPQYYFHKILLKNCEITKIDSLKLVLMEYKILFEITPPFL
jgi:hypothetical protein